MSNFTSVDFINELEDTYGSYKDGMRKSISKGLKGVSPENLRTLFQEVVNVYQQARAPAWGFIKNRAFEIRIALNITDKVSFFKCAECGSHFPLQSRGCPKCKKLVEVTVSIAKDFPNDIFPAKRECFQCLHYGRGSVGPVCDGWGSDHKPDRSMCRDCSCQRCCTEETTFKYSPEEYRKMVEKGNIEVRNLASSKNVRVVKQEYTREQGER